MGWFTSLAAVSLYLSWAVLNLLNKRGCSDYPDLKPNRASQMMYGLMILHRLMYAGTIVLLDSPKVQLSVLTFSTFAVSPRQLTCYLFAVRPYPDFNTNMKQNLLMLSVSIYDFVLLLKSTSFLSSSSDAVSTGFIAVISTLVCVSLVALVFASVQMVSAVLKSDEAVLVSV
jgi:hypothetical protein